MIISTLIARTPDMRAVSTLSWWTPNQGSARLLRVIWEPTGPMTPIGAAVQGLEALLIPARALELAALAGRPEGGRPAVPPAVTARR